MDVFCLIVGLVACIVDLVFWYLLTRIEAEANYVDLFARGMLYSMGFVSWCLMVFGGVKVLMALTGRG